MGHSYKGGGGKLITASTQPAITLSNAFPVLTATWAGGSTRTLNLYEDTGGNHVYTIADTGTGTSPLDLDANAPGDNAFADPGSGLTAPGPNSSNVVTT